MDSRSTDKPEWADSLRNMYESVVDEPIPDSFKDLLSKLDEPGKGGDKA
ncbi:NepR family anti-sigma factor [Alteriqipengyuania sp. 357]